jgi:hypothetical protein
MNQPAPYTPGTINRIRFLARGNGPEAIAHDLGWHVSRLSDVARKHGIEIRAARQAEPDNQAGTQAIMQPAAGVFAALSWDPATATLIYAGASVTITGDKPRAVLGVVLRHHRRGLRLQAQQPHAHDLLAERPDPTARPLHRCQHGHGRRLPPCPKGHRYGRRGVMPQPRVQQDRRGW